MAIEARLKLEKEPKIAVLLPESLVKKWSVYKEGQVIGLNSQHPLVKACSLALDSHGDTTVDL